MLYHITIKYVTKKYLLIFALNQKNSLNNLFSIRNITDKYVAQKDLLKLLIIGNT